MAGIFLIFLRLGLTSFGGPVAHLGYLRSEFVARRGWVGEDEYAAMVGFCQFLPGPASSQVAMLLGRHRAGTAGMLAAWTGFVLPSALLMALFALLLSRVGDVAHAPFVHGLKLAAAAVVAQALWAMARTLTPDAARLALAALAAAAALLLPAEIGQLCAIAAGAVLGWLLLQPPAMTLRPMPVPRHAIWLLGLFAGLLLALPLAAPLSRMLALADAFYRSGALVFGGGHVVLPLLQQAVVAPGWIGNDAFLAGYGAAQAMPGPLFPSPPSWAWRWRDGAGRCSAFAPSTCHRCCWWRAAGRCGRRWRTGPRCARRWRGSTPRWWGCWRRRFAARS